MLSFNTFLCIVKIGQILTKQFTLSIALYLTKYLVLSVVNKHEQFYFTINIMNMYIDCWIVF